MEHIEYYNTESEGFGPGGNEAGLVTFALSKDSAQAISRSGLEFLFKVPDGRTAGRDFGNWRSTPIEITDSDGRRKWGQKKSRAANGVRLAGFFDGRIAIEPSVEASVDKIISSPGSFYTYGRGDSMLIVSPDTLTVVLAYKK